jgi:hypothetical protein
MQATGGWAFGDPFEEETDYRVGGGSDTGAGDGLVAEPGNPPKPGYWDQNPHFGESLLPVWGPMRDAIADLRNNKPGMSTLNFMIAVGDAFPGVAETKGVVRLGLRGVQEAFEHGLAKGGIKTAKSWSWSSARSRLRDAGVVKPGHEAHHVYIPQNGWGKAVPGSIKHRSWNIKSLEEETHRRIHSAFNGLPRFSPFDRYWHGTYSSMKTVPAAVLGHTVGRVVNEINPATRHVPKT